WQRAACAALAALIAGVSHAHMNTAPRIDQGEMFVPRPEAARLWALGFDAVVSDYYWIRALQVVGGAARHTEAHTSLLARLSDVVTGLNPWVDHPYRFAAVWLTDNAANVRSANRLLERGIAHHPLDWRNRYHLGFNHFFYLEENLRAAEALETAVPLEGAPPYLAALVARLRADRAGLETAAGFLQDLARRAPSEYVRAGYLKVLDEVETERRARQLDAARAEYRRRHGRDIAALRELLEGPQPLLRGLPAAHPHLDGFEWVLDPKTGEIVSSFYRSRYELHVHPLDAARRERWGVRRAAPEESDEQQPL
ncbi:MAG: hypothetical protein V3U03_16010, partial [Myxococcota bacterium]